MKRKFTLVLLFLSLSPFASFAQKGSSAEAKKVDSLARSVDRMTGRRKSPDLVFADTADYEADKPKWTTFKSIEELDKFQESHEIYSIAYNWRSKGKLLATNFTFSSPSGDWAQYVDHYFGPDGSTALVKAELRTFEDDCVIKQKYYFDRKGRPFRRTVAYFDLNTNKRKKPCLGADELKFDYYRSVTALPFAELLKKK